LPLRPEGSVEGAVGTVSGQREELVAGTPVELVARHHERTGPGGDHGVPHRVLVDGAEPGRDLAVPATEGLVEGAVRGEFRAGEGRRRGGRNRLVDGDHLRA